MYISHTVYIYTGVCTCTCIYPTLCTYTLVYVHVPVYTHCVHIHWCMYMYMGTPTHWFVSSDHVGAPSKIAWWPMSPVITALKRQGQTLQARPVRQPKWAVERQPIMRLICQRCRPCSAVARTNLTSCAAGARRGRGARARRHLHMHFPYRPFMHRKTLSSHVNTRCAPVRRDRSLVTSSQMPITAISVPLGTATTSYA